MPRDFDIARARRDTPGVAHVVHFNNAGAALMPQPVLTATQQYLHHEALYGGYETADAFAIPLEAAYTSAARLINAHPDEIAFVENATRGWDQLFYGLAATFTPGDRILTSRSEYVSNVIAFLQMAARTGAVIEVIPCDDTGQVDVAALATMLDARVKLVAVTHVPTNGGLVNPAAAIGAVTRAAGIPFLLDACQSVGQFPVDVQAIGCDMLTTTGRKYLRGPRGTGFVYVHQATMADLVPPMLDVHAATWDARDHYTVRADARRFENWETNYAGKISLATAIDYALAWGMDAIGARVLALGNQLRQRLADIPGVQLCDLGPQPCGIVSFRHARVAAADIMAALAAQRINVTTSSPFGTRYDMEARQLDMVVRASVHYYNDDDEIARMVAAVAALVA
ncbi:MAG: aminotransferase class [Chloroflexota bacterium]